jgi:hypothetical protein
MTRYHPHCLHIVIIGHGKKEEAMNNFFWLCYFFQPAKIKLVHGS